MKQIISDAIGLSANERALFDAIKSSKMSMNVSQVAEKAGIPRTTASYVLNSLEKRKLVRKVHVGKRFGWKYNKALDHVDEPFK